MEFDRDASENMIIEMEFVPFFMFSNLLHYFWPVLSCRLFTLTTVFHVMFAFKRQVWLHTTETFCPSGYGQAPPSGFPPMSQGGMPAQGSGMQPDMSKGQFGGSGQQFSQGGFPGQSGPRPGAPGPSPGMQPPQQKRLDPDQMPSPVSTVHFI